MNFTLYMVFDVEAYTEKNIARTNTLKYLYIIYILKYFTQLHPLAVHISNWRLKCLHFFNMGIST